MLMYQNYIYCTFRMKNMCNFVFQQNRRSQFSQMGGTHVQIAITPCFHHCPTLTLDFLECLMIVLSKNNRQTPGHFKQINTPRLSD